MQKLILSFLLTAIALNSKEPIFLLHKIASDHAEGITSFDMDGDGKPDVTSGAFWYHNPDWKATKFREAPIAGEFVVDCGEFAIDVNHDGLKDIVTAGWQEDGIFYFENPGKPGVEWKKVKVADSRNTEGMVLADVDGDGQPDVIPGHYTMDFPKPSDEELFWVQIKDGKFTKRHIGNPGNTHGVGFGDIDGDGKPDVITRNGWFRQIDVAHDKWEWHPEWNWNLTGFNILVYDVNGDGLPDIIHGNGHNYGLYWLEQGRDKDGKRTWTDHVIDDDYSQIHNLMLVDLNGDGKPELLAGKRYRGHNENDPGSFDPLAIFYYTIDVGKNPKFTRYPIAYNSPAGAGTQFVVTDLDGDGDLDILVAGKTGQYWFENLTINKVPWQKRDIIFNQYPAR